MKTSFNPDTNYLEHEHVNEKRIDLTLADIIALFANGEIREVEYANGKVVQVNAIILRAKIGPEK